MAPRGTYRQIANDLRRRIRSGEFAPGAMVPSELALVKQLGVLRGTVRAALALLADDGLIELVPGQGRRVVGDRTSAEPTTAYERIAAVLRVAWRTYKRSSGNYGEPDASQASTREPEFRPVGNPRSGLLPCA